MAPEISPFRKPKSATPDFWRSLVAAAVAIAVGWGSVVYAATSSVQGAKKGEGGFAGDARTFAEMMTKRASELGLTQSTFANSNGLPDPGNKMTVRELAKLARHIIQTYPDFYKLFGEREFTWNKIRQQNRNPLLTTLEGSDGLKTGYTKEGGYGMVGSTVQNGLRLIVVVNGLDDPDDRASDAKKMLECGCRNFDARTLFAAQQALGYAK